MSTRYPIGFWPRPPPPSGGMKLFHFILKHFHRAGECYQRPAVETCIDPSRRCFSPESCESCIYHPLFWCRRVHCRRAKFGPLAGASQMDNFNIYIIIIQTNRSRFSILQVGFGFASGVPVECRFSPYRREVDAFHPYRREDYFTHQVLGMGYIVHCLYKIVGVLDFRGT